MMIMLENVNEKDGRQFVITLQNVVFFIGVVELFLPKEDVVPLTIILSAKFVFHIISDVVFGNYEAIFGWRSPQFVAFLAHLSAAFVFHSASAASISFLTAISITDYGNVVFAARVSGSTSYSAGGSSATLPTSKAASFV